jgi:hypothetical protein
VAHAGVHHLRPARHGASAAGDVQVFEATPAVGEASLAAYRAAETWGAGRRPAAPGS